MSISDLVVRLKNTKSDWTAREIAELVWLWVQTVPSQESEKPPQNQETKPPSDTSQIKTKTSSTLQKTNSSSSTVSDSSTPSKVDLYPKIVEQYIPSERKKQNQPYPLQVPDAPAIPNKLQIERSLKSLLRKFKSATEQELDEYETINRIVERDIWIPVVKPVLTRRWLDLVLVVEVNNSLVIWQQTITELRQILKRLGIFRQFDTWGLQINLPKTQFSLEWLFFKFIPNRSPEFLVFLAFLIDSHELGSLIRFYQKEGIQLFRYDDYQMRPYPPEAISSQPGRETLILLASDLVSPAWYRPEIYTLLQQWSCRGMVNVLQLLPERLWLRTVLGQQHRLKLNSPFRVATNQNLITLLSPKDRIILQYESEFLTPERDNQSPEFKLPVTSLEPYILENWSTFLMGIGNNQSIGYAIKPPQKSATNIFPLSVTSQERIKRFQTIASPTALKLAELLSAVLVTLPVIRVIQYTMLPKSNQSHVAEVLMGGLFQPLTKTVTPHNDPDEIEFHFFPGVREELLSWLTVDEITFAIEQVSAYIADKMGKSLREFEALLMSSQYLKSNFAQQIYPFAQVQAQVLRKLGGEYSQLANLIQPFWKLQKSIEHNQGQVRYIAFSPDGTLIASAGNDGSIYLWNLEGELITTWVGHQDKVWSLAFSADGKFLVTGSEDGKICLWEVNNALLLRTWDFSHPIYSVAFSPDLMFIAGAGNYTTIDILNTPTLKEPIPNAVINEAHKSNINSVAFSSDRKLLASCSDDRTIKLWDFSNDLKLGALIGTLEGHQDWVNAIAFSPDGKILVSASSDLTLRLWNIDEGTCTDIFRGHTDSISSVAFNPNGKIIASGSRDGTVRLWNLQGNCLQVLSDESQSTVKTVAFNPEGTILACSGEAESIYLYSPEPIIPPGPPGIFKILTFEIATIEIAPVDTLFKLEFKIVTLVPKEQIKNQLSLAEIAEIEKYHSDAKGTPSGYQSYKELENREREGVDYRINYHQGISDAVIIAPHGGKIEPGATEIAKAIAGEDHGFYSLEGLKPENNHRLSIPSEKFDEPRALEIVGQANRVIAIHGFFYSEGEGEEIQVGGLDTDLKQKIKQNLEREGFKPQESGSTLEAENPHNICNRGQTEKGVEIGIYWGLRKQLFDSLKNGNTNEPTLFDRFIQAIRDALSPLEAAGLRSQITQGEADYYTEELGDEVGLDMISIPGGSFMMGSPEGELQSSNSERPQHQVTVPSFYMGRYPITQEQWREVAGWEQVEIELDSDPSRFKEDYSGIDRWTRPVERVSWEEAQEFCARLSQKTGKEYRLPTEAEWEYACRAVISNQSSVISGDLTVEEYNQPFHFGQTISTELANYDGNYTYGEGVKGEYREQTTPVGYFQVANNFGLSDMHGNVFEWCEDDWHEDYEDAPTDGSAWFSGASSNKVIRSGSWIDDPYISRSAFRSDTSRVVRGDDIGLRVACVAPRTT